MSESNEIYLGSCGQTLYSDEKWFLIVPPRPAQPFLEGRFQTDAPDRTGFPVWTATEFCVLREGAVATCRLPLKSIPKPGDPNRFASIADAIWNRAAEECAKLPSDSD